MNVVQSPPTKMKDGGGGEGRKKNVRSTLGVCTPYFVCKCVATTVNPCLCNSYRETGERARFTAYMVSGFGLEYGDGDGVGVGVGVEGGYVEGLEMREVGLFDCFLYRSVEVYEVRSTL